MKAARGEPPLRLGPLRAWVFTDLHLRAEAPEEVRAFAERVRAAPADLELLLVMGDLFDAWTGPEVWSEPPFPDLCDALAALAARGVRVILLRGNRDVMMDPRDGRIAGAEVTDSLLMESDEGLLLFTHGDEFCLRDRPYQRLRRCLRARPVRWLARRMPARLRRWAAGRLRKASREAVARKPLSTLALVESAVVDTLRGHEARRALIGHLHVSEERELAHGLRLTILPAWSPDRLPLELGRGVGRSASTL